MEPARRVSLACNSCRRRKVKCNGEQCCQQCAHLGLKCLYSAPLRRVSRTSRRWQRVSEFRQPVQDPTSFGRRPILARLTQRAEPPQEQTSPPPIHRQSFFQQDIGFFENLLPYYAASVYPTHPIVDEKELGQCIQQMTRDNYAKAFVYASAAMVIHCDPSCLSSTHSESETFSKLVKSSILSIPPIMPRQKVGVYQVMTCVFLATCLMALQDSRAAFLYLRQAISMVETWRLSDSTSEGPKTTGAEEMTRRRRLYWLIYIHERYQSISEYRIPIMKALPMLPEDDTTLSREIHIWFLQLVKLFLLVDANFISNWLQTDDSSTGTTDKGIDDPPRHHQPRPRNTTITVDWVKLKCDEFGHDEAEADTDCCTLTAIQQSDLAVTRHWLLALVWRMAMSNGLLGDLGPETCLSLLFPLHISQNLRQIIVDMPAKVMEIHGAGMVQKLFELTDTVADVVLYVPTATSSADSCARLDNLLFLIRLVTNMPHLDVTRRSILDDKLERLQRQISM